MCNRHVWVVVARLLLRESQDKGPEARHHEPAKRESPQYSLFNTMKSCIYAPRFYCEPHILDIDMTSASIFAHNMWPDPKKIPPEHGLVIATRAATGPQLHVNSRLRLLDLNPHNINFLFPDNTRDITQHPPFHHHEADASLQNPYHLDRVTGQVFRYA